MEAPFMLVLDFVEWIAVKPRTYKEANEAWQTSYPRLPVWEDTFDLGYVERIYQTGSTASGAGNSTRYGRIETRRSLLTQTVPRRDENKSRTGPKALPPAWPIFIAEVRRRVI